MPPPSRACAALVLALLLVACGSDGDKTFTGAGRPRSSTSEPRSSTAGEPRSSTSSEPGAPTTTEPRSPATGEVCAAARSVLLVPVDEEPGEALPAVAELVGAMETLRDAADGDAREDLSTLVDSLGTESIPEAAVEEAFAGAVRWAKDECPTDALVWGCLTRTGFTAVGRPIPGPGAAPELPQTPEGAIEEAGDEAWVEVSRTAERVEYAAVDDDGLVTKLQEVRKIPEGWSEGSNHECRPAEDDGDFEDVGGPVGP